MIYLSVRDVELPGQNGVPSTIHDRLTLGAGPADSVDFALDGVKVGIGLPIISDFKT